MNTLHSHNEISRPNNAKQTIRDCIPIKCDFHSGINANLKWIYFHYKAISQTLFRVCTLIKGCHSHVCLRICLKATGLYPAIIIFCWIRVFQSAMHNSFVHFACERGRLGESERERGEESERERESFESITSDLIEVPELIF